MRPRFSWAFVMRLTRLSVNALRCLRHLEINPSPGLNLLLGGNGAGKTSVLEAIYLLGFGRSFRFGGHEALIARDAPALQVYAELNTDAHLERLGFERSRAGWRALRNGDKINDLAELARLVPVVCFSPESHELIGGSTEIRRRFFDWIVFHVEPKFSQAYRRYMRLLRQRNAALKQAPSDVELAVWTHELAEAGELVASVRSDVFPSFAAGMNAQLGMMLAELGAPQIEYKQGWRVGMSLLERLNLLCSREREVGHTLAGPHRADWSISFNDKPIREQGSRGQQKLVALAAVLVSAQIYSTRRGHPPIVALDDLASELDLDHQLRAMSACSDLGAQLWITGTQHSISYDAWQGESAVFHVEHGQIKPTSSN